MNIRFKPQKAPFKEHQVLLRAKILSERQAVGTNDIIDLNNNGIQDSVVGTEDGERSRQYTEPDIHSGADANFQPVGMKVLEKKAAETGRRYFGFGDIEETIQVYDFTEYGTKPGPVGGKCENWRDLHQLACEVVPAYDAAWYEEEREFEKLPDMVIDMKTREWIVYDPALKK